MVRNGGNGTTGLRWGVGGRGGAGILGGALTGGAPPGAGDPVHLQRRPREPRVGLRERRSDRAGSARGTPHRPRTGPAAATLTKAGREPEPHGGRSEGEKRGVPPFLHGQRHPGGPPLFPSLPSAFRSSGAQLQPPHLCPVQGPRGWGRTWGKGG